MLVDVRAGPHSGRGVAPDRPSTDLRPERDEDHRAIRALTRLAFASMAYAAGNEQELIDALRAAGALALSLVATDGDGTIVGHVAFSLARAPAGTGTWYALGPVAVEPARQRQGVGSALIEEGLARLGRRGAAGCILVGDSRYYARFGFVRRPDRAPPNIPAEYFMMLSLGRPAPDAPIAFHPLFDAA